MKHWRAASAIAGAVSLTIPLMAGAATLPAPEAVVPPPTEPAAIEQATPKTCGKGVIPALTPVELKIGETLGSKLSKTGQTFPITLNRALTSGGVVIVPAETSGQGEVVWAKKSGGSGSSGELVLAARFLDVCGRQLRLRSMHLAPVGEDRISQVNTLMIATAASPLPVSLFGYFVSGKQAVVPKGTLAKAQTAQAFNLESGPAEGNEKAGPAVGP